MRENNELLEKSSIELLELKEKLAYTKETRNLENFEKASRKWDFILSDISKKNKRNIENSTMFKSEEYRLKMESLEALEQIRPIQERFGDRLWYVSLRKYPNSRKNTIFNSKLIYNMILKILKFE